MRYELSSWLMNHPREYYFIVTLRNEQVCKRVYHVLYYPYKKNVDVARLHIKSDLENRKDAEEWAVHALFRNKKLVCQGAASRDSGNASVID